MLGDRVKEKVVTHVTRDENLDGHFYFLVMLKLLKLIFILCRFLAGKKNQPGGLLEEGPYDAKTYEGMQYKHRVYTRDVELQN